MPRKVITVQPYRLWQQYAECSEIRRTEEGILARLWAANSFSRGNSSAESPRIGMSSAHKMEKASVLIKNKKQNKTAQRRPYTKERVASWLKPEIQPQRGEWQKWHWTGQPGSEHQPEKLRFHPEDMTYQSTIKTKEWLDWVRMFKNTCILHCFLLKCKSWKRTDITSDEETTSGYYSDPEKSQNAIFFLCVHI